MKKVVSQMTCLVSDNLIALSNCIFDEDFIMTRKRIKDIMTHILHHESTHSETKFWQHFHNVASLLI